MKSCIYDDFQSHLASRPFIKLDTIMRFLFCASYESPFIADSAKHVVVVGITEKKCEG